MEYSLILKTPKTRSFKRWRNFGKEKKISLYRALTYEAISGTNFNGKTIDIGGGNNNTYHNLLKFEGQIDSLNFDDKYLPTIKADLNFPLPILSQTYDNFISLNTYEHIYNEENAISESFRILKDGGFFLIAVPFLYRIHASPFDFHRHSPFWWEQKLRDYNIDITNVEIIPLVWDSLVTSFFTWSTLINSKIGRFLMLRGVWKDRGIKEEYLPRNEINLGITNYAMGFIIKGQKITKADTL